MSKCWHINQSSTLRLKFERYAKECEETEVSHLLTCETKRTILRWFIGHCRCFLYSQMSQLATIFSHRCPWFLNSIELSVSNVPCPNHDEVPIAVKYRKVLYIVTGGVWCCIAKETIWVICKFCTFYVLIFNLGKFFFTHNFRIRSLQNRFYD